MLLTGEDVSTFSAPSSYPSPPPHRRDLLGTITWLFRRWGWIGGLILSAYGLAVTGISALFRMITSNMFPAEVMFSDGYNPLFPIELITGITMVIGCVMVAAGLISALILYRKRR